MKNQKRTMKKIMNTQNLPRKCQSLHQICHLYHHILPRIQICHLYHQILPRIQICHLYHHQMFHPIHNLFHYFTRIHNLVILVQYFLPRMQCYHHHSSSNALPRTAQNLIFEIIRSITDYYTNIIKRISPPIWLLLIVKFFYFFFYNKCQHFFFLYFFDQSREIANEYSTKWDSLFNLAQRGELSPEFPPCLYELAMDVRTAHIHTTYPRNLIIFPKSANIFILTYVLVYVQPHQQIY